VERLAGEPGDEPRHHPVAPAFHEGHPGNQRGILEAGGAREIDPAATDGFDQSGDVARIELAVRVDAHDEVGSVVDRVPQRRPEGGAYAPRRLVANDARARRLGLGAGPVAAAVVHDEDLDLGDAGQISGNSPDHRSDGLLLIEGGDHHQQREPSRALRAGGARRLHGGRHGR
jgi:hypothetical protein